MSHLEVGGGQGVYDDSTYASLLKNTSIAEGSKISKYVNVIYGRPICHLSHTFTPF